MAGPLPLPVAALGCFLTALVLSLYGTPAAARAAIRFGIVDIPDGSLKNHRSPVPYLGGLAVYGSFLLTMALAFDFDQRVLGLLLAGTILVLLGLIDDFGVLGVGPKFLGQGFATLVLIKSDIAIHIGVLPGWANMTLTVLWIVGVTNAFNIIDIMDGLASGVALTAAFFLLLVAFLNGQGPIALMTATLMGSLLGFLRYNRYPARIFMGDTGSLFIGMTLGALAIIGKYDQVNSIGYFTPLLILAVPIFDTLYVMTLRVMKGRNPFRGSPDHFAIRLKRSGMAAPMVVHLAWGGGALLGALGIFNLTLEASQSVMMLLGVAILLVAFGLVLSRVDVSGAAGRAAGPQQEEPGDAAVRTDGEALAVERARQSLSAWRRE